MILQNILLEAMFYNGDRPSIVIIFQLTGNLSRKFKNRL